MTMVLRGWWKGDNNTDDSVGGNSATLSSGGSGSLAYATGVVNQAFDLSGLTNKNLLLPYNALQSLTPSNTWEVEFYYKHAAGRTINIVSNTVISDRIYLQYGSGVLRIWQDSTPINYLKTLTNGNWYKINLKSTAGLWQLWVDDIELTPLNSNTLLPLSSQYYIEFRAVDSVEYYDEIKVYIDVSSPVPEINTHGKTILENKSMLGFKLETVPGIAENLTYQNYKYPIYDLQIIPNIESYAQNLCDGTFSQRPAIAGKRSCAINFKMDLAHSGTDTLPPASYDLLRACGWRQIQYAFGIGIKPSSKHCGISGTFEAVLPEEDSSFRQLVYKISGAMGQVKLSGQVGLPIILEFSFIGSLESIHTRSYADRIMTISFSDNAPDALLGVTVSVLGLQALIEEIEISGNEVLNLMSNSQRKSGIERTLLSDHFLTGSMSLYGINIAEDNTIELDGTVELFDTIEL